MNGKITLVTPPDIFENSNVSILFVNAKEADQDAISKWLADSDIEQDINIYVYDNHHDDLKWLLYSIKCSNYAFFDLDSINNSIFALSSYMLSISNSKIFYKISDPELMEIYKMVNLNHVRGIEEFLEILGRA